MRQLRFNLAEPSVTPFEKREPCPKCGSLLRAVHKQIADTIHVAADLKVKLRNLDNNIILILRSFSDSHYKLGKRVNRSYLINRLENDYEEKYVDPDTGELLYH
jgi:hypothetical protein